MSRLRVPLFSLVAGLALLAATSVASAAGRNLDGQPVPDLGSSRALQGLPQGTGADAFRGKVVVVKFWFTGCPACRTSLPEFQSLYERYAPRGVQFVAVAFEDAEPVAAYLAAKRYTFPVAVDPAGVTPSRFGVVSYPTNYVIGADGTVRSSDRLSSGLLDRLLATASAATAPAATVAPAKDRNVAELGDVPTALEAVRAAAARNDYGEVARLVRDHMDPAKDGAAVAAAAVRIENIVRTRWTNRAEKIRARWNAGDPDGAWADVERLAADFHDTKFGDATVAWGRKFARAGAAEFRAANVASGDAAPRSTTTSASAASSRPTTSAYAGSSTGTTVTR